MDCFFAQLGDERYRATVHTTGPWDAAAQHGGPPSALLGRAVERCSPRPDMAVARVTVELLGAVPVGELQVNARVVRPGRSVELVEATLAAGGRDVARAYAWRVRSTDQSVETTLPTPAPLPSTAQPPPSDGWVDGYVSAVEWRPVSGVFGEPGPATIWTRLRYPLVDGEDNSPLTRVLAIADSGNGISSALDPATHLFINPELTVHQFRAAEGEWVCLDAGTSVSAGGTGLATSVLSDARGPLGVGAQSLLVAAR